MFLLQRWLLKIVGRHDRQKFFAVGPLDLEMTALKIKRLIFWNFNQGPSNHN